MEALGSSMGHYGNLLGAGYEDTAPPLHSSAEQGSGVNRGWVHIPATVLKMDASGSPA